MVRIAIKSSIFSSWGLATAVVAVLAGCAHDQVALGPNFEPIRIERARGAAAQAAQRGLDSIARGDAAEANRAFSLALQNDPRNAALNHMNALSYHLRVRAGDRGYAELAETGYLAALDQRRDFVAAGIQLTRLYLEIGRHAAAQRVAAYVLDIEGDSVEALRLLAAASYGAGDFDLALWATERARSLAKPDNARVAASASLIYAAAGLQERSNTILSEAGVDEPTRQILERRIGQWQSVRETLLAQAPAAPVTSPSAPMTPAAAAGAPTTASAGGPVAPAWFDCQQAINQQQANPSYGGASSSGYSSSPTGDETVALPALPAPCRGSAMPRMAVIDAVLLRSDDVTSYGYGVNLLDNLNVFVSRTLNQTRGTNSSTTRTGSVADVLSLGTTSGGGISYSLNIANASDQSADIIARPSLLALDRQAAQFFSGSTVSVALVSTQGGGTINDKPVGVSLSVTPTFIDDDSMLVSVKAARSFFETTAASATFTQSVQTSRNMVAANVRLRFDETLILSGLSEREITSTSSGVPVLRDIPGLQYIFQRRTGRDYTKSVIILLTPRRVTGFDANLGELDRSLAQSGRDEPEALRQVRAKAVMDLGGLWPNQLLALRHMDRNMLFRGVRTGDIDLEEWAEPTRLRRMFEDAARLLVR